MSSAISFDGPVGRLVLIEADGAIAAIRWSAEEPTDDATPLLCEARDQLEAYFSRRLTRFDLPLEPAGSSHDRRVWAAMRLIGYGQTRSYGEVAMEIGSGPRAVGGACGRNPIPIVIPCHRVLARGGLGGYGGGSGLATKKMLLALEGATPEFVRRKSAAPSAAPIETMAGSAALSRPTA